MPTDAGGERLSNQRAEATQLGMAPADAGAGLVKTRPWANLRGWKKIHPQVDPLVHFCTHIRTRGFRAGFGCPRV